MSDKKSSLKEELQAARQKLLGAIDGLNGEDWDIQVQSEGDHWTVLQMLRHLQDAQKGLTGQLERLLAGQETIPRDFDVDRWNKRIQQKTAEAQLTAEQALANLETTLTHLYTVIDGIEDEGWAKTGWQSAVQREITAEEFIQVISRHEAAHAEEIANAVQQQKA